MNVRKHAPLGAGPNRPSPWITDLALFAKGIVPADASYHFPAATAQRPPYDRGHLCAKFTAWRMGADADWNTHTLVNACPQHIDLNQGIWENPERKVDGWRTNTKPSGSLPAPSSMAKKPRAGSARPAKSPSPSRMPSSRSSSNRRHARAPRRARLRPRPLPHQRERHRSQDRPGFPAQAARGGPGGGREWKGDGDLEVRGGRG